MHKTIKYIKTCTIIKINLFLTLLYIYLRIYIYNNVFSFSYLEKIAYHKTADVFFIKSNSRELFYKSLFFLHMYIYNMDLMNKNILIMQ